MSIIRVKEQQSITDFLVKLMPNLLQSKPTVNEKAAKTLFSIWNNQNNKINDKLYAKPATVGRMQVETMEKEGLAKQVGNNIEITDKGSEIIRVMVLGDNSSIFDENYRREMNYSEALATTKNASRSKKNSINKSASNSWWDRFETND